MKVTYRNVRTRTKGYKHEDDVILMCLQNDHGGPLITWVGGREILIGVASVFMLRDDSCVGPYLYTSTNCNGLFLGCILRSRENNYR